ncbi:MAG: hypothetical protein GYB68_17005 [Chloroflexi bacterium]|nr:hypothetical protein [Chloroflexota bacterium]
MKRRLLLGLFILTLCTACGPAQPPELRIVGFDNTRHMGDPVSGCWLGTCYDGFAVSFDDPFVLDTTQLVIEYGDRRPREMHATVWALDENQRMDWDQSQMVDERTLVPRGAGDSVQWWPQLNGSGDYIVTVQGDWPNGDVMYAWSITFE